MSTKPMLPVRVALGAALLLISLSACGTGERAATPAASSPDSLMKHGLRQLYDSNNPVAAQQTFRAVIAQNPTHYGAHYQLAVALDRGAKPVEARTAWEDMRQRAQAIGDSATLTTVLRRLAAPDTASQEATMALGLYDLYQANDPAAAAQEFRKVIAKNPSHYGASYQLAKALDLAGKREEATPLWRKVLGMATVYRDSATIRQARERLK